MVLHLLLLPDPACHGDSEHEHPDDCLGTATLQMFLTWLPTIFHSFGHMALLDDVALALPENLSFVCGNFHSLIELLSALSDLSSNYSLCNLFYCYLYLHRSEFSRVSATMIASLTVCHVFCLHLHLSATFSYAQFQYV